MFEQRGNEVAEEGLSVRAVAAEHAVLCVAHRGGIGGDDDVRSWKTGMEVSSEKC